MKVELKVVGGARSGQTIPITIPQFMIGRAEDCHLKPRSELISRYHCAILVENAYVAVRDMGSKNGVYVNGDRIGVEQELKNGDRLAFGPLEFEVVIGTAEAPKNDSLSDLVARTVQENSLGNATVEATPHVAPQPVAQPVAPQPVAQPVAPQPVAQPVAPQPVAQPVAPQPVAQPAAPQPVAQPVAPQPVAQPAAPQPIAQPAAPQPVAQQSTGAQADDDGDLASWLLGDDEGVSEETQTLQASFEDLDLPYTPQEPKEETTQSAPQKPSGPSSSDAAANLLKNFFKGGR